MANQGFIEEQHHQGIIYSQLGFYLNSSNLTNTFSPIINHNNHNTNNNNNNNNSNDQYDLKPLPSSSFALDNSFFTSINPNPREDDLSSSSPNNNGVIPSQFSLLRSTPNLGVWEEGRDFNGRKRNGEEDRLGVSGLMKMKKMKTRRKVREPRFCFKTMSDVDVLDDGYKWRKYGQKVVKNTLHPRSYYRCTQDKCRVKKRVERLAEDPRMVITTYEGRHVHSPSQDVDDSQVTQPLLNNFFW
ncbi:hypothetical protein vseg_015581 [Gypsophila vaccaria]